MRLPFEKPFEKPVEEEPEPLSGLQPFPVPVSPVPLREREKSNRRWRWLSEFVNSVSGLVSGGGMYRQVGPNSRPLERYEFENPSYRDQRRPGMNF
jgi:hypothetical protein